MDKTLLSQAKDLLTQATSIIVLLPPQPDDDLVSSASSLYQTLKQSGKSVIFGCSTDLSSRPQAKDARTSIGNQKLVISFDYLEEKVENVSYDLDESGRRFNLVISPKAGSTPLDPASLNFSYTGASADLVITLGINSLEELGKIYSDEKVFLDQASIVNLTLQGRPSTFAKINLSASGLSSGEFIATLLRQLGFSLPHSVADALYQGLTKSTNSFQAASVTPDTFELAAFLMRHTTPKTAATPASNGPSAPVFFPNPPAKTSAPVFNQSPKGLIPPAPKTPLNPQSVPADWQKPKIFRANTSPLPTAQLK